MYQGKGPLLPTTNKPLKPAKLCTPPLIIKLLLVAAGVVGLLYATVSNSSLGLLIETEDKAMVAGGKGDVDPSKVPETPPSHDASKKEKVDQADLDWNTAHTADQAAQSQGSDLRASNTGDALGKEEADVGGKSAEDAKVSGLYAMSAVDIDGREQALSQYAGNVTVVMNVASYCGFTDSNYKGLQELYEKYKARGFTVLAFPCNQFGKQEPDGNAEIKEFAREKYNVTFPIFSKIEVNGGGTSPIYQFLKGNLPAEQGGAPDMQLVWNFQKFIVDRNGNPRYYIRQNFDKDLVESRISELLSEPIPS